MATKTKPPKLPPVQEQLAELIADHLDATSGSVNELADQAGARRQAVSGLKNGTYPGVPGLDLIESVAAACGHRLIFVPIS